MRKEGSQKLGNLGAYSSPAELRNAEESEAKPQHPDSTGVELGMELAWSGEPFLHSSTTP